MQFSGRVFVWIAGLTLLTAATCVVRADGADSVAGKSAPDLTVSDELQKLVNAYFTVPKGDERKELLSSIERESRRDVRMVAEALRRAQVWSAANEGPTNIFFAGPGRPSPAAVLAPPLGYSSKKAYPMVLFIPDEGLDPEVILAQVPQFLGDHTDDYIAVGTRADIAGAFYQPGSRRAQFRSLVRNLRKRLHTNTNRLYLLGVGTGADAAWIAAMRHPDLFAGVVAINGYPNVPYPRQAYPLMLESLRDVPVLSVWNDVPPVSVEQTKRATEVAKHNKLIADLARSRGLPIESIELPYAQRADRHPPVDAIAKILAHERVVAPKRIDHWFRYPDDGWTSWLRQKRFAGDVWDEEAFSVATAPGADRDAAITGILREKLAHLQGVIEGQTVTLTVGRTTDVEIMIPMGVLDPSQDVTVICNGRTRHEHKLPPAIDVMLEDAYERWEFMAPAAVRLLLSVKSQD